MKTLDEHNAEQHATWNAIAKMKEPHPNGIACPDCGEEMWDSDPMVTLDSYPPQKNVHCPKCGYRGYRLS